jgi:hypothetical protein
MKISELRVCDACGGSVLPMFFVVRLSAAILSPDAAKDVWKLVQMLGGMRTRGALATAEALVPEPDCIKILGDEDSELITQLFICTGCVAKDLNLLMLTDTVANRTPTEDPLSVHLPHQ